MRILIINGPNLNMLGISRDKDHYGDQTLDEINKMLQNYSKELYGREVELKFLQSNCEGELIDFIQTEREAHALIINPGALAHYSYALCDALDDFPGIKIEVHLSLISAREEFRRISVTKDVCDCLIAGKRGDGYKEALDRAVSLVRSEKLK
jgi:3-dehydroquinate dehydratase-2